MAQINQVYIGIKNRDNYLTTVYKAHDYQANAFNTFMSNPSVTEIHFNYPGDIIFKIIKFNTDDLQAKYTRFCVLENEQHEQHILSDDHKTLAGFAGWRNRLTAPLTFGGGKTKKISNKNKKNKKINKKK